MLESFIERTLVQYQHSMGHFGVDLLSTFKEMAFGGQEWGKISRMSNKSVKHAQDSMSQLLGSWDIVFSIIFCSNFYIYFKYIYIYWEISSWKTASKVFFNKFMLFIGYFPVIICQMTPSTLQDLYCNYYHKHKFDWHPKVQ